MVHRWFTSAVCLAVAPVAMAGFADRSFGQNQNDRVEGTLTGIDGRAVRITASDGRQISIPVDTNTRLSLRCRGDASLLRKGVVVEVHGDGTADGQIENADVTVYLQGPPRLTSRGGAYYRSQASRGDKTVPVSVVGVLVSVDPLVVRGHNSITSEYYFFDEVGTDGQPTRTYTYPTTGKNLAVTPRRQGDAPSVLVDMGNAVRLVGDDARVVAYIDPRTELARSVFVFRQEPIDLGELGIKPSSKEKGSGSRSRSRSKKNKPADEPKSP